MGLDLDVGRGVDIPGTRIRRTSGPCGSRRFAKSRRNVGFARTFGAIVAVSHAKRTTMANDPWLNPLPVRHTSIVLPYNKRPKSDSPTNASSSKDDDLGDETLVAKEPARLEALARMRARGSAAGGPGPKPEVRVKEKASGSLDRPRLFQDSLSEDDVTRLMPSTRDVAAVGGAGPSKPTLGEFSRARPAAGRAAGIDSRPRDEDELATNVFDQPSRGGAGKHGGRAILAGPNKATLLEPVPGFMDGSDERATISNEQTDSERALFVDSGERAAFAAAEADRERAKRAPAAFARVEPVSPTTAPHPFAPRPATPLAAASAPALPAAALSDARIDVGTSVTGATAAISDSRPMGAWAVAFAAVVLLVAGGAFAALKNPGAPSEAAVALVDPMSKPAAAPQPLAPAPIQVQPPVQPAQPVLPAQPVVPVAAAPTTPPVALPSSPAAPVAAAPAPAPAPEPVAAAPAKTAHHTAVAAPPPPKPVAAAAPPAPKPVAVAAPPPPKPEKAPKKGAMSDEEKKLSDEAKALADKQLQQSL